jgi:hypothetical protein
MEIQMNIKRAFLTSVALLMLPGFALAQTIVRFDTSLELVPAGPYTQTVTVELTCNTGNPLVQDFEIGPTTEDKVVFVVDNFNLEEFISCEITATSIGGFRVIDVTGNIVEPDEGTCLWTADAGNLSTEGDNLCRFIMAPETFEYVIEKEWDFSDDVDVSKSFSVDWTCNNVLTATFDSNLQTVFGGFGGNGDTTYAVTTLMPNPWADAPGEFTTCWAQEFPFDSAIESDQGCSSGVSFATDNLEGGCVIVNSVFFEGIPTLSQYGLAIMALLMLGVGFVGFRRFV